jgi:hypothetical protein
LRASEPWYGFRIRAGRIFLTLGDRESDVWVADIERQRPQTVSQV